jgi:uncharacterized integral membrane protein
MRYLYIALIVVLTALVLVFTVQNLGTVSVAFLTASVTLPLSILVILVYLLGMVTGGALFSVVRGWIQRARVRP